MNEENSLNDVVQRTESGVPYIEITDVYTEEEQQQIWRTLDSLEITNMPRDPAQTGASAHGGSGQPDLSKSKQCYSMMLSQIYGHPSVQGLSPLVLTMVPKFDELRSRISGADPAFRHLGVCQENSVILNYYGDGDRYEDHIDTSRVTAFTFFAKDPSKFEGGNLVLENEVEIAFEHNKMVYVPGWCSHRVTPVSVSLADERDGNARWSIAMMV